MKDLITARNALYMHLILIFHSLLRRIYIRHRHLQGYPGPEVGSVDEVLAAANVTRLEIPHVVSWTRTGNMVGMVNAVDTAELRPHPSYYSYLVCFKTIKRPTDWRCTLD